MADACKDYEEDPVFLNEDRQHARTKKIEDDKKEDFNTMVVCVLLFMIVVVLPIMFSRDMIGWVKCFLR